MLFIHLIIYTFSCSYIFRYSIATPPTFEIPNRHNGYLNKAGNEIQHLNDGQ